MKMAWRLAGLVLLGGATFAWSFTGDAATEKAITALEKTWTESQQTNNPDLVAPLLADQFVATSSTGDISDKATFLAEAKHIKYTSVEYVNDKIKIFGNTALVTGRSALKGLDPAGKPFDFVGRFTDVWVKMPDGKWQCISSQDSPKTT